MARIRESLQTQGRVLFALIMREMTTRYGRSAGGYVWAALEPIIFILMMSAVFSQIAHSPPLGRTFALFYATGYMAFHFYLDISTSVGASVEVNRPLFSFPRVTPLDTVIARFALQFLTCCFVTAVLLGGMLIGLDDVAQPRFGPILLAVVLASVLALGVGALNCVLFAYSPTWQRVFNLINRPLFLISGIFFVFEELPRDLRDILWWNPLVHVSAIMREGFYPGYEAVFASPFFVLCCAAAPLMLGVLLLRALRSEILET